MRVFEVRVVFVCLILWGVVMVFLVMEVVLWGEVVCLVF